MKVLILTLAMIFSFNSIAKSSQREYLKARKQYLLEYTVFGVDECLSQNYANIVVDKEEEYEGKVLVGSPKYFELLQTCFKKLQNACQGESCLVKRSMHKRLDNIRHVDKVLHKSQLSKVTKKYP